MRSHLPFPVLPLVLVCALLVPGMEALAADAPVEITRDGGMLTASNEGHGAAGEGLAQLVDGDAGSKYLAFTPAVWIQYEANRRYVVTSYALTAGNDHAGRDPAAWRLQGSLDGGAWTTIDSQERQVFTERGQTRTFTCSDRTAYACFRLDITAIAEPALKTVQLAGLSILGTGGEPSPLMLRNRPGNRNVFASGLPVMFIAGVRGGKPPYAWQWFRNGTRVPDAAGERLSFTAQAGDHGARYHARIADATGAAIDTPTATLTIRPPVPGDWSSFTPPTVRFIDKTRDLEGAVIFKAAIPDPIQMMKEQCLVICQALYADGRSPRNDFTRLDLMLEDSPKGVAWKSGSGSTVTISISAQYLEKFFNANGRSHDLVQKEVRGVLSHEGAHGYQWSPKGCGGYDGKSTYWGLVEGVADGVRGELTNWTPPRHPKKGGNWNDGYTTGGFFLCWCRHNKKPSFLIELNQAAHDMPAFSWDAAFRNILGQPVQEVWNEYQASL